MKHLWALPLWLAAASAAGAGETGPEAVVRAKFAAVNRNDLAGVTASYAPQARLTASNFCAPRQGRADVERTYRAMFAALPDLAVTLDEVVASGERVAVRFRVHSAAAGLEVPIANFFTVRDGLIERDEGLFDNGGRPCTP
jgi:hypothetical protein